MSITVRYLSIKTINRLSEKMSELQHRLDDSMAREVQIESEMAQEKRARLEEKNSINEKLIKVEIFTAYQTLEFTKTKILQHDVLTN